MVNIRYHRKPFCFFNVGIIAILISSQITTPSNPYGILLSYVGAAIFVLTFTDDCISAVSYRLLTVISTGVALTSIVLNNLLGELYGDSFLDAIRKFLFFLTIFIAPFGMVIGTVGSVIFSDKSVQK